MTPNSPCSSSQIPDCAGICTTCISPSVANTNSSCIVSNCLTCTASPTTGCTACFTSDYIVQSGICVQCNSVPGKVYTGSVCVNCGPNCATCQSNSPSQCLTCNTGSYLYPDFTCGPCTTVGYYVAGIYCRACNSPCAACLLPGTYCTKCIAGRCLTSSNCNTLSSAAAT